MGNMRRARFIAWFEGPPCNGDRGALVRLMARASPGDKPLTKGRVSQLFNEDEPFGETAARNLALRLGLPEDFFERDRSTGAPPLPPRDFHDRREVSDSDFGLLQDVHFLMTEEELEQLRARAERMRRIAQEQMQGAVESQTNGPAKQGDYTPPIRDSERLFRSDMGHGAVATGNNKKVAR